MSTIALRILVFLLCLSALVGLGQYFSEMIDALPHTTRKCLEAPKTCDGVDFGVSVYVVHSIEGAQNYTIARSGQILSVVGDSAVLDVGQRISVRGTFRAEPTRLEAAHYAVHHFRLLKELYGILTLVAVAWWLWKDWRLGAEGLYRA